MVRELQHNLSNGVKEPPQILNFGLNATEWTQIKKKE